MRCATHGRDAPVIEYLAGYASVRTMIADLIEFLDRRVGEFAQANRSYLTIAVGCTGGQHRSVYIAEQLAEHFRKSYPQVLTRHDSLHKNFVQVFRHLARRSGRREAAAPRNAQLEAQLNGNNGLIASTPYTRQRSQRLQRAGEQRRPGHFHSVRTPPGRRPRRRIAGRAAQGLERHHQSPFENSGLPRGGAAPGHDTRRALYGTVGSKELGGAPEFLNGALTDAAKDQLSGDAAAFARFVKARDAALTAIAASKAYIDAHVASWPENYAIGREAYDRMLHDEQLLPFNAL
jgi:hypothetical protein